MKVKYIFNSKSDIIENCSKNKKCTENTANTSKKEKEDNVPLIRIIFLEFNF